MDLTWGLILNSFELRLLRRAEGFVSSYVGFDLTSIAEGSQPGYDAWKLLWAMLRSEALAAEPMIIDRVVINGRDHQAGVSAALGDQVQQAIVAMAQGILSNPANRDVIPDPIPREYLDQFYAETFRILYRILFALYAEARNLLPLDIPTYRDGYSLFDLAHRVTSLESDPRQHPTTSGRFFEFGLRSLFELLRRGADLGPEGRIPQYNGAMFDHSRTELIESLEWGDETVANVLDKLTRVHSRAGLIRLSYLELDVEQLGAVYESLLEQVLQIASEPMYRVILDGRELVVTETERRRLAERRGEVLADSISSSDEEADEESEEADSDEPEDENESDDTDDEERPERRSSAKPLKVVAEITLGSVYLKSGMGRKQTGSFYTARPLVEFLVRRSIDPLAEGKTPEQILSMNVVDPAMGSGHFLVGACRRLSEHLLSAYRKTYDEVQAAQPELPPEDIYLEAGIHPEVARNWEFEDRALTACRLLVAGNCIYGVDKNPLAVELARVSLWLATAATDHPLTFLDHRLRAGDSLLGMPVFLGGENEPVAHLLRPEELRHVGRGRRSRSSDTPLFEGAGVLDVVTAGYRRLRQRLARAMQHLKTISELTDERPGDFAGHRVAFIAMQGELKPFVELHSIRIGKEFLGAESVEEVSLVNRWLEEVSSSSRVSEETRQLAERYLDKGNEHGAFCWYLAFPEVFFTSEGTLKDNAGFDAVIGNPPWDKIKPNERECFSDFDPTVWDVQGQERRRLVNSIMRDTPAAKEAWETHESETKLLSKFLLEGGMYQHQIAVVEGKKTGGDPDLFKFFTERAWQLIRNDGRAGIIVPLGIQGSLGTTGLRRLLLDECQLQALIKLDNERYIFPGVFHGQKFDLLVFAKGRSSTTFDAAFLSWEPGDVLLRLESDPRRLTVEADLYRELSPEQYTFVELHDQREVDLLRRIYRQFPRLGETLEDSWNVSFTGEFHMTNDSFLFRDVPRLTQFDAVLHSRLPSTNEAAQDAHYEEAEGGEYWITQPDNYYTTRADRYVRAERWVDSKGRVHLPGAIEETKIAHRMTGYVLTGEEETISALPVKSDEKYVPLYEGRMVHQFDHCQKGYVSGSGRRARWIELPWDEKRIAPHFFASFTETREFAPTSRQTRPGICLVTGQTNERSTLVGIIPDGMGCGHAFATVSIDGGTYRELNILISCLNSYVIDWIIRLQISNNIGMYHLRGLPIIGRTNSHPPDEGEFRCLFLAATHLLATAPELAVLWERAHEVQPSEYTMPWTNDRACLDIRKRAQLRASVDAYVARLYGLSETDYARILSTFPLLDQDQPHLPGDCFIRQTNKGEKITPRGFITRDLALLTFLELTEQEPPADIVQFFKEAGVDIERNTGPIRDLRTRVEEATRRGAVAYIPTQHKGWRPQQTVFLPPDLPSELIEDWSSNIDRYVVTDPQINGGEPTLANTRITTRMVFDLLKQDWTFTQVLESYPHLTAEQIAISLRWGDLQ